MTKKLSDGNKLFFQAIASSIRQLVKRVNAYIAKFLSREYNKDKRLKARIVKLLQDAVYKFFMFFINSLV